MKAKSTELIGQVNQVFDNLKLNFYKSVSMNEQLSQTIKLALEVVSKEYQEPEILDESFEDFDLDQIDENGPALQEVEDQIVQNNP